MKTGNTIILQEGLYEYPLPSEPRDEKLILNYQYPKKDQVWRKPEIQDVKKMPMRSRIEYIEMWDERFYNGMWIFIEGEPVYLTGMHVDFLCFSKFDFGWANYLEQQRFDFYFRDLVRKDPRAYGKAILKCRRCGMTAEEIEEAIYTLLEDENSNVGLQSNEREKCLRTLMHPLIQAYLSRPVWMRGKFYAPNGKKPRNSLELISNRIDVLHDESEDYLGGTALPYPTTAAAMDGTKKRFIVMDEAFKWIGTSTMETMDINKKCVVEYGIKGKVDVLSTMGDSDQVVEAVKEGCKIIYDSNPRVRDENGRTNSGLYEWFVAAIHSADIPEEHRDPTYTKFGKINKDKAEAYVNTEVNKYPKDSKQRVFAMRRLPLNKKHGLMAASDKQYFPILRMDDRLHELNELPMDKKPYLRGNLTETTYGKILFEPDESGLWLVSVFPYVSAEKNIDTSNRFRLHNGIYFPPINAEFVLGYDPVLFKTKNTTSNNLSKACIVAYKKFDYFGSGIYNEYAGLLLYRPEDPRDAHYELLKACRFWGAKANIERNTPGCEDVFEDHGMTPFLMTDAKGIVGMTTTSRLTEAGVQKLATRFSVPKTELDKDQVACYPFEEGLIDFKSFDMGNTQSSHITMATIMCEFGADQLHETNQSDGGIRSLLRAAQEIFPPLR